MGEAEGSSGDDVPEEDAALGRRGLRDGETQ